MTGEKLGVLSDILRPQLLEVDAGKLYVVDGAQIYIYSAKDLTLIKKFGNVGDGPGELRSGSYISNSISVLKHFNMLWPDFIPLIRDIIVTGNNQTSVFLPRVMASPFIGRLIGKGIRFFNIENDKFYYIAENEDEEEWEVHVEIIK